MLSKKRAEFGPRKVWLEWLSENCPDISRQTADRFMGIYELYFSHGDTMALPKRIDSVRGLYEDMRASVAATLLPAAGDALPQEAQPQR